MADTQAFHRIREVRLREGVSSRVAVRRLGLSPAAVREQESPHTDLRLSELCRWGVLLNVPISELLIDDSHVAASIRERSQLLLMMKTVRAIKESRALVCVGRLADRLADQLVRIMPELRGVKAWHVQGENRSLSELGRVAESDRVVPCSVFSDVEVDST